MHYVTESETEHLKHVILARCALKHLALSCMSSLASCTLDRLKKFCIPGYVCLNLFVLLFFMKGKPHLHVHVSVRSI